MRPKSLYTSFVYQNKKNFNFIKDIKIELQNAKQTADQVPKRKIILSGNQNVQNIEQRYQIRRKSCNCQNCGLITSFELKNKDVYVQKQQNKVEKKEKKQTNIFHNFISNKISNFSQQEQDKKIDSIIIHDSIEETNQKNILDKIIIKSEKLIGGALKSKKNIFLQKSLYSQRSIQNNIMNNKSQLKFSLLNFLQNPIKFFQNKNIPPDHKKQKIRQQQKNDYLLLIWTNRNNANKQVQNYCQEKRQESLFHKNINQTESLKNQNLQSSKGSQTQRQQSPKQFRIKKNNKLFINHDNSYRYQNLNSFARNHFNQCNKNLKPLNVFITDQI